MFNKRFWCRGMIVSQVVSLQRIPLSLIKFLLVGVVNTLVGLSTIYLLKWFSGTSDTVANAGGYLLGLTVSFTLNRRWTFRHAGAIAPAFARFAAVFAIAYLANLGTVLTLIQFGINGYLSQAMGVLPYITIFYLGSRYSTFVNARNFL
jgi:putative flippase GtrA